MEEINIYLSFQSFQIAHCFYFFTLSLNFNNLCLFVVFFTAQRLHTDRHVLSTLHILKYWQWNEDLYMWIDFKSWYCLKRSSGTEWRKSVLMCCFIPNLAWWSDWTIRGSLINSSVAATFYWFGIDRVINARFNTTCRETVWGLGGTGLLLDHQASLGLGVCFTPWGCMFTAQCWGLD